MKKNLLALSIASLLVGCGGGDGGSSSSSNSGPSIPPSGSFTAYNGLTVVKPGEEVSVDLRNYVEGATSVFSIASDNVKCTTPDMGQMSFSVKFDTGAYCLYDYVVKNSSGETKSATITVLSTSAEEPTLPPISKAMNVGSTNQAFDVSALLGEQWKSTFSLNANSVSVVAGEDSIAGTPNVSGNTITFDAPETGGWNRILYTVSDSANPDVQMLGTIYITLSTDVNDAPVISQLNYDYTDPIIASQSEEIDVAALTGLTITDDGDWQLIDVQSFTANVAALDPNSVTNTAFTFVTPTIGEHVVSYTVADHMGGFATGLINITVSPNERDMTWSDIGIETTVGSYKYTATPRYSDVATQLSVGNTWDAVVENTVATFSFEQADLYCSGNGRVPSLDEIKRLYEFGTANREMSGDFSVIPKQLPYITYSYTDSNVQLFDMNNGTNSAATADSIGYVSCIKDFSLDLEVINTRAVANLDPTPIARITKGRDTTVTVSIVPISLSDGDVNVAEVVETDNEILLLASGTVAGTFRVSIEADGDTLTTPIITMTGDAAAAAVSGISYSDYDADGVTGKLNAGIAHTLVATVDATDPYSNVIADKLATLEPISAVSNEYCVQGEADEDGNFPPEECFYGEIRFPAGQELITDANGQVLFEFEADRDLFDEGQNIINWSYNINVNNNLIQDTIKIVHPDYESIVIYELINKTNRYSDYHIYAANLAEEVTTARLNFKLEEVHRGMNAFVLNNDGSTTKITTSGYNVFEAGVKVRIANSLEAALNDTTFTVSIPASASERAIQNILIPASDSLQQNGTMGDNALVVDSLPGEIINGALSLPSAWFTEQFDQGYDVVNLINSSSGGIQWVYLPQLTESHFGVTVTIWNPAQASFFVGYDESDPTQISEIGGRRRYMGVYMWVGNGWIRTARFVH